MRNNKIWTFCVGAAVVLLAAGVALAGSHDHNDPGAKFTDAKSQKVKKLGLKFSVDERGTAGDCTLKDAKVTMRASGKVTWSAIVSSTGSNNSYCTSLIFSDANDSVLFKFPRFCSPTLFPVEQIWENDKLAIPQHLIPNITRVSRADHC